MSPNFGFGCEGAGFSLTSAALVVEDDDDDDDDDDDEDADVALLRAEVPPAFFSRSCLPSVSSTTARGKGTQSTLRPIT